MDCATCWMYQYPASPGYGPLHHHTCWEVYIGNTPWRTSNPLTLFCVWSEQFCPSPVHCMQTGAPIWAATPWPASALILAILEDLAGPGPARPILFVVLGLDSLEVLVGWTTGNTWLAGATCPTAAFVGISTVWTLKLCRQIGTLEDPGCNSL